MRYVRSVFFLAMKTSVSVRKKKTTRNQCAVKREIIHAGLYRIERNSRTFNIYRLNDFIWSCLFGFMNISSYINLKKKLLLSWHWTCAWLLHYKCILELLLLLLLWLWGKNDEKFNWNSLTGTENEIIEFRVALSLRKISQSRSLKREQFSYVTI